MAAANGTLIVPAGSKLIAYRTAGAITDPPANDSLPSIDGSAEVGQLVAADVGIWSGLPTDYAYQWQLCNAAGANCSDIDTATDSTYTPTDDETGSTLRVEVTGPTTTTGRPRRSSRAHRPRSAILRLASLLRRRT